MNKIEVIMKKSNIPLFTLTTFFVVMLLSCSKWERFVVIFDSNGGTIVAPQIVTEGGKITEPSPVPTKEGNIFVGWFTYDGIFVKWNFDTEVVTTNTTLYARWMPITFEEESKKITVPLLAKDDYAIFEKTVILLENEDYLIKTPFFYFTGSMHNLFGLKYNQFLSMLKKIATDARTNNLMYASSYFNSQQINYVLANFLENGRCFFYDKKSASNVKQVEFEYKRNSVSFSGCRKFFIKDVLFLETIDSFIGYQEVDSYIGTKGVMDDFKQITVPLMERDDYVVFEKIVTLYESEKHIIITPLSYFLSGLSNSYLTNSYEGFLSAVEKVILDAQTKNLLHASPYFPYPNSMPYILASFLERGQCFFYDKEGKNILRQVVVGFWNLGNSSELSGCGGRRFYIDGNVLFLETVDWVS